MKHHYFFAVLIAVLFFSACQKQMAGSTALNSAIPSVSNAAKSALKTTNPVRFGAMIIGPNHMKNFDFEMGVAGQLGVSCLREEVTVPAANLDTVLVPALTTRYNIALNFNSFKGKTLIPFRTDLGQYKKDLNDILNTFTVMPVVAAIENEESNRFYYYGSAQQYINQLRSAISVMHTRGIKVTNGGITRQGLAYLTYKDFLAQGKNDSAALYMNWAAVFPDSPMTQSRGAFIDTLLTNYKNMTLDFVNFHWKGSYADSTQAFSCTINYLKKRTGKKIIINELGQFDIDPNTLVAHVQVCVDNNFPYIMWYSPDVKLSKKSTPLQYSDGTLTPSGVAYQGYIADH